MKCAICNGDVIEKKGEIKFESRVIGNVSVPDLSFFECIKCQEKLLNPEMSDKAVDYIEKKEAEAVELQPFKEFITAQEAYEILGITKQAFSKNPKIKRGSILSRKIGNRKYYLRKSVEIFKKTGNGKYLLPSIKMQINTPCPKNKNYCSIFPQTKYKPSYSLISNADNRDVEWNLSFVINNENYELIKGIRYARR